MPSARKYGRHKAKKKLQSLYRWRDSNTTDSTILSTLTSQNSSSVVMEEDDKQQQMERRRAQRRVSRERVQRRNRLECFKKYMDMNFFSNTLHEFCHVCDRIWWSNKLRTLKQNTVVLNYLVEIGYDPQIVGFKVCSTCINDLRHRRTPHLATVNGFVYPEEANLPALCPITERLISPRLPFMSIRHMRYFEGSKKLCGQIINVPVDVDNMTKVLPRSLDDDYAFNIRIKRNLLNKSSYLAGCVSKSVVKEWLRFLIDTPLYKRHNVQIDPEYRDSVSGVADPMTDSPTKRVIHQIRRHCTATSTLEEHTSTGEQVMSLVQETLFWGEDFILEMAPGQNAKPLALAFDGDAEELSFPSIYYGQPREFKVSVTAYQMATSEIRRRDRRGVRSNHILYMAGKIMRLKVINSFNVMFRNNRDLTNEITRESLEDAEFLRESLNRNESFLSCLPNSIQYWQRRKSDLFAMMRQLGKPTIFMTLSASEIHWVPLMKCIYRFQQHIAAEQPIDDVIFAEMSATQRAQLVNSDPVLCCLYFDRLVDCIVNSLKLKKGPFGKYHVVDYFRRVEFQHRGSPHCHMLLWLDCAPSEEEVRFADGENVPKMVELIDELCTVDSSLLESERKLQTHHHTHTCFKKNTKKCRFHAPFWPMKETRVLLPIVGDDRLESMQERYVAMREMLEKVEVDEDVHFDTIEDFWNCNNVDDENEYLNIIRHGIKRPTVMYKRSMRDLMTSPFNPTISSVLQSNMDIQYIVDEYTCAAYVAEYVNKSERGFSSLHRELIRLRDEYPDMDYEMCMKEISKRALNDIEISVQEAAWFLLRLPMSEASRQVYFIPTQHPSDRFKSKKSRTQMNRECIEGDSTDVWKKNIIEHYEERPRDMSDLCLAHFVADYDRAKRGRKVDDEREDSAKIFDEIAEKDNEFNDDDARVEEEDNVVYRKRKLRKIIKWVNFDANNELNYKREMVTLFWPFHSEELNVLNEDAYLSIYRDNCQTLLDRRAEYEKGLRLDRITEIVIDQREEANRDEDGQNNFYASEVAEQYISGGGNRTMEASNQDIDSIRRDTIVRAVKNAMSHENFCKMVRSLNFEQRSLLIEFITRLVYGAETREPPLQIFFCGPAGSGKTYLLRALMETVNRFAARSNTSKCTYVACATTGKAAVNIDGTTVHSALKISINAKEGARMPFDKLQTMRCDLDEVCTIIIDEVSMMSNHMLNRVGDRLRDCGKDCQNRFGGFHVVLCGDLRQLPPVNAKAVYSRPANILQDRMLWQNLDFYPLVQVVRQSDEQFSNILTKIGDGRMLEDHERTLIESRFFDSKYLESCVELNSAVRLFHRNEQVNDYNYKVLCNDSAGMMEVISEDVLMGCANNHQRTSTLQKLQKMDVSATGYLPRRLCLVLGKPYMVTQNIDKNDRIVNGSMGVLRHCETTIKNGEEFISRLWLEFEDELCGAELRLKYQQHMIEYKINSRLTPILRRELPINVNSKIIKVKRKQFPVLPANAITIHKSQGASFDKVVYEYDRSQELSLVYVALSRARSLDGLFLTNAKRDHRFRHCTKDNARVELQNEFKRLETKRLLTLTHKCHVFIESAKRECAVTVASFNVQSLHAHSADVSSDFVLKDMSLLALSETWMHGNGGIGCSDKRNNCQEMKKQHVQKYGTTAINPQCEYCLFTDNVLGATDRAAVEVDGFRCITRTRREIPNKRGGGGIAIYESLKSNFTACHRVDINTVKSPYGDVCCAFLKYIDKDGKEQMCCLVAFYCEPSITGQNLMDLMDEAMWRFTRGSMFLQSCRRGDLYYCPLIVCGDFNYNFRDDTQAEVVLNYLRETHMLEYNSKGMGMSTRNGTVIDAVFTKRIPVEWMYYTIYFSTHRGFLIAAKQHRDNKCFN